MIQLSHLLKKDYDKIKEFVIWEKDDQEEVDLLAKSGLIPQLVSVLINPGRLTLGLLKSMSTSISTMKKLILTSRCRKL